jgi:hypothetical protein
MWNDGYTREMMDIWVWVKFMDYEFRNYVDNKIQTHQYSTLINDFINPIIIDYLFKDNKKVLEICDDGRHFVKKINGNHFHIFLFIRLQELIKNFEKK